MSSLEPIPSAIAKPDPGYYRDDTNNHGDEPPAVKRLWKRIRWLFALNVTLAIASGVQAYYAYRGNELTRDSLAETRKATEAAVIASRAAETQLLLTLRQMDAMYAAINSQERIAGEGIAAQREIAKEQLALGTAANLAETERFRLDQRARIVFDVKNGVAMVVKEGAPLRLQLTFHNTGKTEARNYRQAAAFIVQTTDPNFIPATYPAIPETVRNASVAADGVSTFPANSNLPLSKEMIDSQTVYVFGRARYDDTFGVRHHWRFCRAASLRTRLVSICDADQEEEEKRDQTKP
jgi:hypothetical protein